MYILKKEDKSLQYECERDNNSVISLDLIHLKNTEEIKLKIKIYYLRIKDRT